MRKKLLAGITILGISAMMLTGCGNSGTAGKSASSAPEKNAEAKKVTIVTSGNGLPYSLLEDGNWTGIDAEMWAEIENRTGWDVEVKQAGFDSIFGELDSGRANLAANCFAEKPERMEKYYASVPYYGDAQCLAVGKDSEITTFADLKGKRVGVNSGQASETILEGMQDEYGFELVVYESLNIGYADVALGRLDAMGGPVTGVNQYINASGDTLKIVDEKLLANNVVYYFAKTEEDKALRDEVDQVLQKMLEDGTVKAITEKWLFEDMTTLIK